MLHAQCVISHKFLTATLFYHLTHLYAAIEKWPITRNLTTETSTSLFCCMESFSSKTRETITKLRYTLHHPDSIEASYNGIVMRMNIITSLSYFLYFEPVHHHTAKRSATFVWESANSCDITATMLDHFTDQLTMLCVLAL